VTGQNPVFIPGPTNIPDRLRHPRQTEIVMFEKPQTSTRGIRHLLPYRLAVPLAVVLLAFGLAACTHSSDSGPEGGGEAPHGEGGEGGEGGEESATQYGPGDTFYMTRAGARLILSYDAASQAFTGTVTNVTGVTLSSVRVEVHLSSGVELGPTTPMDLAPGQTIPVSLPATGQVFATWGAHPEVGSGSESTGMVPFTPSLGAWAVVDGVPLGIEHPDHQMSAWYTSSGGTWTPHLSPDPAPEHQPTGAATWTGKWAGYYGSNAAISTGAASVTVTLGTGAPEADLSLQGVPTLGTLQWDNMPVDGGRFMGSTTANSQTYDAVGQFGGANQAGVVGHATGSDFRSVFYGEKP